MLVAIHQPHDLPWLGYLHRMAQAGGGAPFTAGLSCVDLLFNHGPASRDLLAGSTARECRIAA